MTPAQIRQGLETYRDAALAIVQKGQAPGYMRGDLLALCLLHVLDRLDRLESSRDHVREALGELRAKVAGLEEGGRALVDLWAGGEIEKRLEKDRLERVEDDRFLSDRIDRLEAIIVAYHRPENPLERAPDLEEIERRLVRRGPVDGVNEVPGVAP